MNSKIIEITSDMDRRVSADRRKEPRERVRELERQLHSAKAFLNELTLYRYHTSNCAWRDTRGCDCGVDDKWREVANWMRGETNEQ